GSKVAGGKKLKKVWPGFERPAGFDDQYRWERLSLPDKAVYGASAHPPQRPYSLTRPVVPPGGSFRFAGHCRATHTPVILRRSPHRRALKDGNQSGADRADEWAHRRHVSTPVDCG